MKKHQNNTSLQLQLFYFTSSPYGVSSPKSYPLWDGPILLHLLAQNSLDFKTFVGRLVKAIHNSYIVTKIHRNYNCRRPSCGNRQ